MKKDQLILKEKQAREVRSELWPGGV